MPPNRLRTFRDRAHLSRSQLGRLVGIEGASIYRIETGRAGTALPTAQALARALSDVLDEEVTVDDLFPTDEDAGEPETAEARA